MEKSVGTPLRGTVIRDEARALNSQLVEWRRHLHRHPELAFDTQDTAAFVAEQLEAMGAADIKTGVGLRASGRGGYGLRSLAPPPNFQYNCFIYTRASKDKPVSPGNLLRLALDI